MDQSMYVYDVYLTDFWMKKRDYGTPKQHFGLTFLQHPDNVLYIQLHFYTLLKYWVMSW